MCEGEDGPGGEGKGPAGPRKQRGGTANKAPAIHKYQRLKINCLVLRVSHARSSGPGTMIPGAKSCGSVGKLGDRADPEGATASNGDVPEARGD